MIMNEELQSTVQVLAVLAAASLVMGPLVWYVVRAAAQGRLQRNPWFGIRLISRELWSSESAWNAGHAAALPIVKLQALALVGLAILFGGAAAYVVASDGAVMLPSWTAVAGLAAFVVVTLTPLLYAGWLADRAARLAV